MYATERHQHIADTIDRVGRVCGRRPRPGLRRHHRDDPARSRHPRTARPVCAASTARRWAPSSRTLAEASLDERLGQNTPQKDAIARAALALIPPTFRGSVLLDAGSTTGRLAELLAGWSPDLPVRASTSPRTRCRSPRASRLPRTPTSSCAASAARCAASPALRWGPPPSPSSATSDPDLAFVGTNGVSADFGFSTPDEAEAAAKAAMVHAARRVVVLADSTKLDAESLVRFACLDEVDTLITDAAPAPALADALAEADVQVVLA